MTDDARSQNLSEWAAKLAPKKAAEPVAEETPEQNVSVLDLARGASTKRSQKSGTEKLARQATDILVHWNSLLSIGAFMCMMPETASAISEREEVFDEMVFNALLNDEKMCKRIIAMSGKSATIGLALAYGGLAAGVAPAVSRESENLKNLPKVVKGLFSRD